MGEKTKTLLLTNNLYLALGFECVIGEVTSVYSINKNSNIKALLRSGSMMWDFIIIDEVTVGSITRKILTENCINRLSKESFIFLSRFDVRTKNSHHNNFIIYSRNDELINLFSRIIRSNSRVESLNTHKSKKINMKKLTEKEFNILSILIDGIEPFQVSQILGCSVKTIYSHQYNILEKLGFKNIKHLVLFLNELRKLRLCAS